MKEAICERHNFMPDLHLSECYDGASSTEGKYWLLQDTSNKKADGFKGGLLTNVSLSLSLCGLNCLINPECQCNAN